MGGLIAFTVIFVIAVIVWICYSISKRKEIVGKEEQSKAAIASYKAIEKKGTKVRKDAIEAVALYFDILQREFQKSRELMKSIGAGSGSDRGDALRLMEVYPKELGSEVVKQLMLTLAKESDDLQYAREKANARIGDYNALVEKGQISHIVAKNMRKIVKTYIESADEPLLKELMATAGRDLFSLTAGTEEKPEEWIRIDKKSLGIEDSEEEKGQNG